MSASTSGSIAPEALAQQLQSDHPPFLLDVRTAGEYNGVHVAGSVNIPLHQLDVEQVRNLSGDRPISVMCQAGSRARQAQQTLQHAGLHEVTVVEGGIQAWVASGQEVQRGKGVIPLDRQLQIVIGLLLIAGTSLGFLVHPYWLAVPGFVGLGLLNAGLTGFCPMATMIALMPWNRGAAGCATGRCGLGATVKDQE